MARATKPNCCTARNSRPSRASTTVSPSTRACAGARPDPRPNDRLGYVQSMLPELEPSADRDIAYLCGNPDMVDATFAALKEAGLGVRQIRREKYISSR